MSSRRVGIAGVGTSSFGRFPEQRIEELAWEAIAEAIDDSGLSVSEFDAAFVGSVFGQPGVANRVLAGAGLGGIPAFKIEAACASGTVALHEAQHAVASGRYNNVLAVGVEQLPSSPKVPDVRHATSKKDLVDLRPRDLG